MQVPSGATPGSENGGQNRRIAACYLVGPLTFGLGAVVVWVWAWHRRDERLALHAIQAFVWNWAVMMVAALLGFGWLGGETLGKIISEFEMPRLSPSIEVVSWCMIAAFAAGLATNVLVAVRIVRGGEARLPLAQKALGPSWAGAKGDATDVFRRGWNVICYTLGSASWGLVPLLMMLWARNRRLEGFSYHARRSAIRNGMAFGVVAILPLLAVGGAILAGVIGSCPPRAVAALAVGGIVSFPVLVFANVLLNIHTALHAR
jgi:hypothetical protein